MKRPPTAPSATRRAIAGGAGLAWFAGALAVAGSVALAQQSWETTVSTGPPPAKADASAKDAPAAPKPAHAKAPAPPPATAADAPAPPGAKAATVKAAPAAHAKKEAAKTAPVTSAAAKEYCVNIASAAADARLIRQKKMLADIEAEIAKRIALLEEKTAEYQKWLTRRDEFTKKANDTVLRIYARMRPDSAAVQLAALDEETAAAVLTKLEPRLASLILNDMDPAHAARLTATISNSGKVHPSAPPKAKAEAGKQ
jgi:flagellar motility protein MotE (MotC chaperone)